MDGDRIMNASADTLFCKIPDQVIALLNPDGVNMIDVFDPGRPNRRNDLLARAKCPVVLHSDGAPALVSTFQMLKFDAKDCSLNSVHSAVPAHHGMVVFANLAV